MRRNRNLLAGLVFAALPGMAHAQCQLLRTAVIPEEQQRDITLIQTGLRAALQDDNALLADDRLGAYTRVALVRACNLYPLPDGTEKISGTLQMAREYGQLEGLSRDWYEVTSDAAFANTVLPDDGEALNLSALKLAGPPELTASILNETATETSCDNLIDTDMPELARAGALALTAANPADWTNATTICNALGGPGGIDATTKALTSFGTLETELPGSVYQVLSPDFALWLGEDIETRGPRLVGSDQVVVALVAEYRAEDRPAAPRDFSALYRDLPDSCVATEGGRITDYTAIDQTTVEQLTAPVDVLGLLDGVAEQSFDSSAELRTAINDALVGQVSQCALDQINIAVNSAEDFGLLFSLNAGRTANLTLVDSFSDSAPIVAPLVGLTAQNRSTLLSGARAAIQDAIQARIDEEVELAAATLAAASEPVSETFDTLVPGVPEFEPLDINPTIGVTEATDSAIIATVQDEDFRRALLASGYAPAPNEEVLKGNVRAILAPIADNKVTAAVNRDITQLLSAVDSSWSLTDTLTAAIAAAPDVANAQGIATDPAALETLQSLVGLEYPNERLLDSALAPLSLDDGILSEILSASFREAGSLSIERETNIALPDCGCVTRREDNTEIYGFYPFWLAPVIQNEDSEEDTVEDVEQVVIDDPATRRIDFGLVSRAAFYGLEFVITDPTADPDTGRVILQNESIWIDAQRDFVNAAHQHRAKADLAIKLTGWDKWTDGEIDTVVRQLDTLMQPFDRVDSNEWSEIRRAFPTILDDRQADGLTLIIDGYDGSVQEFPNIGKLIRLITTLHDELDPRGQTINLAFDLALASQPATQGIFSDIRPLLIGDDPLVNYVLVFLERPTTDTKKRLRSRMERGEFKGIERTNVLRRILPVIPPGGHENVLQSSISASGASTTAEPFSQFTDDLVYFQDNFAGVGFWPSPDPVAPETAAIEVIFAELWLDPQLPSLFSAYQDQFDRTCTFVCPNRTLMAGIAALIFLVTMLVIWRSFYSGLANRIAYKFGLAWAGGAGLFGLLMALTLCDHVAIWPPLFLFTMIVGLGLLMAFHFYQSAQNGPKP